MPDMTPEQRAEAEKIAKGLTLDQRHAVRWATSPVGAIEGAPLAIIFHELEQIGVVKSMTFTPLGQRVAQVVER